MEAEVAEEVEEDADAVVEAEDGDEVAVAEEVADEDEATAGEEATTKAAAITNQPYKVNKMELEPMLFVACLFFFVAVSMQCSN